jgi:ParB family chromosome partitioning protein
MNIMAKRRSIRNVSYVPVEEIVPGPLQPRQHFSREGLEELRDSIAQHGVLQPLTVRQKGERFELIAGERRLRAARMAGLTEVPCILMDVDMESSGVIALIENIQRRDLDYVEEAEGIHQLIRLFGLSQEQTARRLGKSQSAVANKLRLLRLPRDVLERARAEGLTERHARALLRLDDPETQRRALDFIIDQRMTVAAAEEYIDRLCAPPPAAEAPGSPPPRPEKPRKSVFLMKDVRLFLNTMDRSVDLMRSGGVDASVCREETDDAYVVTVRIPKR